MYLYDYLFFFKFYSCEDLSLILMKNDNAILLNHALACLEIGVYVCVSTLEINYSHEMHPY